MNPMDNQDPRSAPTAFTAVSVVPTPASARYAKQLAAHLGRKAEIRDEAHGTRILLAGGDCLLTATQNALILEAHGPDQETLDRVAEVVGRHLERFGQRNELVVVWR